MASQKSGDNGDSERAAMLEDNKNMSGDGGAPTNNLLASIRAHRDDALVLLLVVVVCAFATWALALDVIEFQRATKAEKNQEVASKAALVAALVAEELSAVSISGSTAAGISAAAGQTNTAVKELEDAASTASIGGVGSLKSLLTTARSAATANSYSSVVAAADAIALQSLKDMSDSGKSLLGGLCSNIAASHRITAVVQERLTSWNKKDYLRRRLTESVEAEQRCYETLLPGVAVSSPTLATTAALGLQPAAPVFQAVGPLQIDLSTIHKQVSQVREAVRVISASAEEQLKNDKVAARTALILSVLALFSALLVLIVGLMLLRTQVGGQTLSTDVRTRFRTTELHAKMLPRYHSMLTTCTIKDGDAQLRQTQRDSFLIKIMDFVNKIRPFIPQTSFGDIEQVSIAGSKFASRAVLSSEDVTEAQAIQELRWRELRAETGIQLVSATVMVINIRSISEKSVNATEVSNFLNKAELIVNGSGGVFNSLGGDSLIVMWNVTSSTSSPQAKALQVAYQLYKLVKTTSIGIASGNMVAGNVAPVESRKSLAAFGPAMLMAERLEGYNFPFGSNIMVCPNTAEAMSNRDLVDAQFCVRQAALVPTAGDGNEDYVVGYAMAYHQQRPQRAKLWTTTFKEVQARLAKNDLDGIREELSKYKTATKNKPDSLVDAWLDYCDGKALRDQRKISAIPEMM